jgi:hypothetical protein
MPSWSNNLGDLQNEKTKMSLKMILRSRSQKQERQELNLKKGINFLKSREYRKMKIGFVQRQDLKMQTIPMNSHFLQNEIHGPLSIPDSYYGPLSDP